jgi:hypothetical protein
LELIDKAIANLNRVAVESDKNNWTDVSKNLKKLKQLTTSYVYLSLLTFHGLITKLNYQPDMNHRAASVQNFFVKKMDLLFITP